MRSPVALSVLACLAGCMTYTPKPNVAQPADFEFRLGPGDRVAISVWKEDLSEETEIGPDGNICFPLIGEQHLEGLKLNEARILLAKQLTSYFRDPQVIVALKEMHSHVIHVMGEVYRPGSVPFVRGATVVAAVQAAGSYIPSTADIDEVRVVRDRVTTPIVYRVDLVKIAAGEDTDMYLEPGDLVYVPPRTITSWDRGLRQLFGSDPSERFRQ
jgi:polysaccharide biosynthesis/export protein